MTLLQEKNLIKFARNRSNHWNAYFKLGSLLVSVV